jgi:hypothetical protein
MKAMVEELITLVNGAAARGQARPAQSHRQTHKVSAAPSRLAAKPITHAKTPEEQIPLRDGASHHSSSDFSEFGKRAA